MKILLEINGGERVVEFAGTDSEISYATKYGKKYFCWTFPSVSIENIDAKIYLIETQLNDSAERYNNYYIFTGTWLLKQCDPSMDKLREVAILNAKIKLEQGQIKNDEIINGGKLVGDDIDKGIQCLREKLKEAQEKKIGFC